ncbi:MAG: hypothetical protein RMK18_03895 [Armatimonadota bacterium]|nr:hypothetical protein [Armatimonadota bacterium]MCX7777165.1 hypothetical protein [Armatimonadota bacterium]MDW8024992.1 hypothetical protein [Armatimonadota bacterium]
MRAIHLRAVLIALAVFWGGLAQHVGGQGDGVLLRYKGKVGDTMRYKSWFRMRLIGLSGGATKLRTTFSYEAIHSHRISSVFPDGTFEMETTRESGKVQRDGREEDLSGKPYKRAVRISDRGKVIEEKVIEGEEQEDEDKFADPIVLMDEIHSRAVQNIAFPESAVKIGTEWTTALTERIGEGTVSITIKSRVIDFVELDGHKCAVIESEISAPLDLPVKMGEFEIKLSGEFKSWTTLHFDYERGIEVLSEDQIRMVANQTAQASGQSLSLQFKVAANAKTVLLSHTPAGK